MSTGIYIFSRPVRSGKTTELAKWLEDRGNTSGVLMPDIGDIRYLRDIAAGDSRRLELETETPGAIRVGRFIFDGEIFTWGRDILQKAATGNSSWLVIDEIGKLELEGAGFEPAVSEILLKRNDFPGRLLLVVRDSLLSAVINHYTLNEAVIVHHLKNLR